MEIHLVEKWDEKRVVDLVDSMVGTMVGRTVSLMVGDLVALKECDLAGK